MCDHNTATVMVSVRTSSDSDEWKLVPIDSCLAPIIDALQKGGIVTSRCCCGHGKTDGFILLEDRLITITQKTDKKSAKAEYLTRFEEIGRRWDRLRKHI
jgi:hypothetical protein